MRGKTGTVGSAGASITESFSDGIPTSRLLTRSISAFVTAPALSCASRGFGLRALIRRMPVPLKLSTVMLPSFRPRRCSALSSVVRELAPSA